MDLMYQLPFHALFLLNFLVFFFHCFNHSDASQTNATATESVTTSPLSDLDTNEFTNNSTTDLDAYSAFNTPSPIVVVLRKKPTSSACFNHLDARKQTYSQVIRQYRKSLSESDLLNEIDNALVFSKGFLYSCGK